MLIQIYKKKLNAKQKLKKIKEYENNIILI